MNILEASNKWNISERRIRKLIADGRISGVKKVSNTWIIPDDTNKPIDKRVKNNTNYIINLDNKYFKEVDEKYQRLNSLRPLKNDAIKFLQDAINLEWTFNSNGIEGNTLTLKETKVVLEGITIGGKSIKEHLEVINHESAINYLEELIQNKESISEWNIKELHQLVLKGIDDENAGRYRQSNVIVAGTKNKPVNFIKVPEEMEKLIIKYNSWNNYHPIVRSCLLHGELVKIHPFIDGNGRTSRLIMNMELMKNGYVPVIIKKENRVKYYEALDKGHVTFDYTDFIKMIVKAEKETLDRYLDILGN